jgi:tetratricopeptide (TPR) repeat protein
VVEVKDKCISVEELSAHVDADLEGNRAAEVAAHLEACAECRLVETHLRGLKSDLAKYRNIGPKRDLWPEIDQRLSGDRDRSRTWLWWLPRLVPIPVAAAAVLAVVLLAGPTQRPEPSRPVPDLNRALATVEQAELAYRDAIASLEKALEKEKAGFDPKTLAIIEKSLSEIEAAIERSRAAMQRDPGNVEANRAMLAAYRQKMDFLFELLRPRVRRQGA